MYVLYKLVNFMEVTEDGSSFYYFIALYNVIKIGEEKFCNNNKYPQFLKSRNVVKNVKCNKKNPILVSVLELLMKKNYTLCKASVKMLHILAFVCCSFFFYEI